MALIDFTVRTLSSNSPWGLLELPPGRHSSAELFQRGDPDSCSCSRSFLFVYPPGSPSKLLAGAPPVRFSLVLLLAAPPVSPSPPVKSSLELLLAACPVSPSPPVRSSLELLPTAPSVSPSPPVRTSVELLLAAPPGSPFSDFLLADPPAWLAAPPGNHWEPSTVETSASCVIRVKRRN